ncbi:bicaudal D-related protein homolog isoform X2 [Bacillus rossius redtenbacheri]|uniref:bicaudal D-related protein homolog isoform X2 n=1 Tax=Bacillus rossius redtenbacheri TaxID=93214 RepID=UPI002FDCDB4C
MQLSLLEQDRHLLRRRLETSQSDYETRLVELQADISDLQHSLEEREAVFRQVEKEKALLISELTAQNLRLTSQLKESSRAEEQLSSQLQGLKDECHLKKSSLQDHVSSLEMLREEIHVVSEKKADLERRLQALLKEREALSCALEEATDRIVVLEQHVHEQQLQMLQYQKDMQQLQSASALEALTSSGHSSMNKTHRSLLQEMECEDDSSSEAYLLKEEVMSVYRQLHALYEKLMLGSRSQDNSEASLKSSLSLSHQVTLQNYKVGTLLELSKDLSTLVSERLNGCRLSGDHELERELHRTQELMERLQQQYDQKVEKLKQHTAHIMDLESKLSVQETRMRCTAEERDQARSDVADTRLAQDQVVRRAWEARDKALARKNQLEVELARTRIEMMQANSQLMEAIQQKVELSEQLDQWQMDVQCLLDDQVKNKLSAQELRSQVNTSDYESCSSNVSSNDKKQIQPRRIFGIFQR